VNLLYLCHRIPYPPNKGDKIRSFHQVRGLSERHSVHLATFVDTREDLQHVEPLRKLCRSVEIVYRHPRRALLGAGLALPSGGALSVAMFRSSALRRTIAATLRRESIDAAVVFSSAMAQYVPPTPPFPVVLDLVDVDSEKWRSYGDSLRGPRSWIYRLEGTRLARFEEEAGNAADHCVVISQAEAALLEGRIRKPVSVITNGVDQEYFRAPGDGGREGPALVFVGAMDYVPNEDAVAFFCDEILPRVRASVPDATFTIVGRNPAPRVRDLARLPGVTVTGSVPDVRPYVANARVAVAPFRIARGIQNKVLEAMAMGRPVVGTALAFQGLSATEADGVRIVDHPEDLAREIVLLLGDPGLAADRGIRARAFVEREHRWEVHVSALESILSGLVSEDRFRGTPIDGGGGRRRTGDLHRPSGA
jgi:sugar transferase (PEP-CTERM/EpsH1 system associated)